MKRKSSYNKRHLQVLEAAKTVLRGIEKIGDLERFIESIGLRLERVESLQGAEAALLNDMIVVVRNGNPFIERLRVLHELGHHYLHSLCIGYYQTDKIMVIKQEREAETFAALILFPSLEKIETEKEFIITSGLPEKTAKLRINFWRRTGI